MGNRMHEGLAWSERIKRRLALMGGSYTHADGYIELDFDRKAGINQADDSEGKFAKLDRLGMREAARERFWRRVTGAGFIAVAIFYLADGMHVEHAMAIGALIAWGVFILSGSGP